jgi:hypothetical protein
MRIKNRVNKRHLGGIYAYRSRVGPPLLCISLCSADKPNPNRTEQTFGGMTNAMALEDSMWDINMVSDAAGEFESEIWLATNLLITYNFKAPAGSQTW